MEVLAVAGAWALNNLSPKQILSKLGLASLVTNQIGIHLDLAAKLSRDASIVLPSSPEFSQATSRWQEYRKPDLSLVINAATERDVQEAILYANQHDKPFIAMAGGHGATDSLGDVRDGVQIGLRGMNQVTIGADGKTAKIGGGAMVKEVVDALWAAGKQTVTGVCECVGMSAPLLGGGHGLLQGQHGLLADQVIEARMVLANGSALTMSEHEHEDLFWAIRGAGHNFGILTEVTYRIYDVNPNSTWAYEFFMFTGDKVEELYTLTNEMMKTQPPEVIHWTYMFRIPDVDPIHPIVLYIILYDGPQEEELAYSAAIRDLGPINIEAGEAPYPALPVLTYMGNDGPGCARGMSGMRFPIGLTSYDVAAVRKTYEEFDNTMQRVPELNGSFFLLEGYSTQAVKAIPEDSTAFPHRSDELLLTTYIIYKPDPKIDPIARAFGQTMRQYLLDGTVEPEKLRAYVNYAHGDESLQAMYGWEDWRLDKLRGLKEKYDPTNTMRWYAPIV